MGMFTYTLDQPSTDVKENKRLGYRIPRSVLLPPYLSQNPYYVDYAQSLDDVLGPAVDEKTEILANLRNMWVTDPTLEQKILTNQMLDFSDWPQFERPIAVKQVNALGMKLQSAGLITDDQYQTISRWIGQYWFGKGTQSFIDFINYCLSVQLTVQRLWTQDYVSFVPDGDPSIGTAIWNGGTWYPTSHVSISAAGGLRQIDPASLALFFYEIANYNLVLQSIDLSYDLWMVDHIAPGYTTATIVAAAMYAVQDITMSNFARFGASPPSTYSTDPSVNTKIYMPAGAPSIYMLAAPSSWLIQGDKKFPVYSYTDQQLTTGPDVPTNVMGGASTNGQVNGFRLLAGPVSWVPIPTSPSSPGRVPGYSATPSQSTIGTAVTAMVGAQRKYILANPAGFADLGGTGYLSPYWNLTD